jgi:centromere protein I
VPEVHTSWARESITLEEIESAEHFVRSLERIAPPNQMIAVLEDPLLQQLLLYKSPDVAAARIDNWLSSFFEDQLSSAVEASLDMLRSIRNYAEFNMVGGHAWSCWLTL